MEVPPEPQLLVKFVFTAERLSIQVHPNDEQARQAGHPRGKTEMWVVLDAKPGATIGVGLREPVTHEQLRRACVTGEVEHWLDWKPVHAGDVFLVDAGTIHAIGAGLVLCEIQQDSDITYRLYDYGRPRPLHLDEGIRVSHPEPHAGAIRPGIRGDGVVRLAECDYFATDEIKVPVPKDHVPAGARPEMLIAVGGSGVLGRDAYRAGEAWLLQPEEGPIGIQPAAPSRFLRTYVPRIPARSPSCRGKPAK